MSTSFPSRLAVGTADLLIPAEGNPQLRYASVFARWEAETGGSFTVRHRRTAGVDLDGLQGGLSAHPLIGDDSSNADLTPGTGSTFIRVDDELKSFTYGSILPETKRSNTFASRTSTLTGMKLESRSESGRTRLAVYQANVTGDEHVDRFDELGMTGPYYLSQLPVAPGSIDVWLVTRSEVPGVGEVGRVRLFEGVDYVLDPRTGALWLSEAPVSTDDDFNPRYLEVMYRADLPGVVGQLVGLRVDALAPWGPMGISVSSEHRNAATHQISGLDGTIGLGADTHVSYEIATSQQSDGYDAGIGAGIRVRARTNLSERLAVDLAGEWIRGKLRPPGRAELREGTTLTTTATYRLSDRARLQYERGYEQVENNAPEHSDKLQLSTGLGVQAVGADVELRAGIESRGSDVWPTLQRRSRVHAGIGLSWGRQLRLSVAAGMEAESHNEWKVVTSTEASVRAAHGSLITSVRYRHTFGGNGSGMWVASLEATARDGLNAYTRFSANAESADWTLGARQVWQLTDTLSLTVGAEGRTAAGSSKGSSEGSSPGERTAMTLQAVYLPTGGTSRAMLVNEMEQSADGARHTTRASWQGRWESGWAVQLGGTWISGQHDVTDSRRVLHDELSLAVDYRDPVRSRHTVLGRLILRRYGQHDPAGMGYVESKVDVVSVDYGPEGRITPAAPMRIGVARSHNRCVGGRVV